MTTATGLRRLIPVGWKGGVRALVDLLASRHAFEATPAQRDEIARRAERFLAAPDVDPEERLGLALEAAHAHWAVRADAFERLDAAQVPWELVGSLAIGRPARGVPNAVDDARLASAVMIAARETLVPTVRHAQDLLSGTARVALAQERDGGEHWDAAARVAIEDAVRNARSAGADRHAAALKAVAAFARLKGRGLPTGGAPLFRLGAGASILLKSRSESRVAALEEIVSHVVGVNAVRAALVGEDPEVLRLVGAAGARVSFGCGELAAPRPLARPPHVPGVPAAWSERLGRLTVASALDLLDEEALDIRNDEPDRRRIEALIGFLRRHPAPHAASFADALGIDPPAPRLGALRTGLRVFRTAQRGIRPVICRGKKGRILRCHAVAGPDGAMVGFLAYDALSREFGQRPLYAAYAADGRRWGFAWADEAPRVREGEPEQGFRTAPASIPV